MHLFTPRISESGDFERFLGSVVDRVFIGSNATMLVKLSDVRAFDLDELKELRCIIDRKLNEYQK